MQVWSYLNPFAWFWVSRGDQTVPDSPRPSEQVVQPTSPTLSPADDGPRLAGVEVTDGTALEAEIIEIPMEDDEPAATGSGAATADQSGANSEEQRAEPESPVRAGRVQSPEETPERAARPTELPPVFAAWGDSAHPMVLSPWGMPDLFAAHRPSYSREPEQLRISDAEDIAADAQTPSAADPGAPAKRRRRSRRNPRPTHPGEPRQATGKQGVSLGQQSCPRKQERPTRGPHMRRYFNEYH